MSKWKILLGGCILASSALMAGCDGDDAVDGPKDGGSSGGIDGSVVTDGGSPDSGNPDGSTNCNFAVFVSNLIQTQTTATSTPSTDLGQNCSDNRDPKEFAPLFP